MEDGRHTDSQDPRGREALLVLFAVLLAGFLLIVAADRLLHLGPALGNALFVALSLVAATAAATRLHHHN
jgi:hypothetical protein